ncbi:RDD family protein [Halorarum halophilum]|uniref:RDD family protein n=1 Tax=Halorarum halophilum TaxID=2743090 RepID=A0A7D5GHQ4_9EURY|nr:RDD family protein [Halobaculum halophilum]QLG29370.1 RDD family protein [Halobaculum halophilum]
METHSGQTLGKKALGLVVVTEEGGAPDVAAAAIRNLLRFVDWLPAFYLLGAIVVAISDRDQRLGDLAADTLVVRVADTEERVGGPDGDGIPDELGAGDGDGEVA